MTSIPRWVTAGVGFAVVWIFVAEAPGTLQGIAAGLVAGLVLSMPVAYTFRALFPGRSDLGRTPTLVRAGVAYVLDFAYELLTANIDVAKRVLSPSPRLNPGVVVVPLRVESNAAITTIANSITLTPGTLTMDYDAAANALTVHAVDIADVEDRRADPALGALRDRHLRRGRRSRERAARCRPRRRVGATGGRRRRGRRHHGRGRRWFGFGGYGGRAMNAPEIYHLVLVACGAIAALCALACTYRVVVGPTVPDRAVALDTISTCVVALVVVHALEADRSFFVLVAVMLAIVGFVTTVVAAKYLTEGAIIE